MARAKALAPIRVTAMFNALTFAIISDCVRDVSTRRHDIDKPTFKKWQKYLDALARPLPNIKSLVDKEEILRLKFLLGEHTLFFYLYETTDFHRGGRLVVKTMSALLSPSQIPSLFEKDDFSTQIATITARANVVPGAFRPKLSHHQRLALLSTLKRNFPHD